MRKYSLLLVGFIIASCQEPEIKQAKIIYYPQLSVEVRNLIEAEKANNLSADQLAGKITALLVRKGGTVLSKDSDRYKELTDRMEKISLTWPSAARTQKCQITQEILTFPNGEWCAGIFSWWRLRYV